MRAIIIFMVCMLSGNAFAEDYFGGLYHKVNRHVKMSGGTVNAIPMQSVEFDVSTSHYGVYDGFGVIAAVMGGAANEQKARNEAIKGAYIPKGQTSTTVSYSWVMPELVTATSYFAFYGDAAATNVAWTGASNGGVQVGGMDFAVMLPTYDEFTDYGITVATSYGGYKQDYTYRDGTPFSSVKTESVFVDPLRVALIYQDEGMPWVALHAQASYAPLMGLIGAIFDAPQPYGYGFGASAPVGPFTFEGFYEYFHSGWGNGTSEAPTVVTSSSWYVGGRVDVIKAYMLLTK